MTDRPILFSAPMVRALLAGRKTQTRRIINFAGVDKVVEFVRVGFDRDTGVPFYEMKGSAGQFLTRPAGRLFVDYHFSPRFAVGDRLYVRETWAPLDRLTHNDPGVTALIDTGFYRADEGTIDGEISRWTPGIHMPRRASRLTLTVTEVRVERLQEISESDSIAEGCVPDDASLNPNHIGPARSIFEGLWDSLNAERGYGWDTNPWVVAISFTVERRNIDEVRP